MELSVAIQVKVEVTPSNWNFGFQPTYTFLQSPPMEIKRITPAQKSGQLTADRSVKSVSVNIAEAYSPKYLFRSPANAFP